jgi:uncharacterized protein with HEPN domain
MPRDYRVSLEDILEAVGWIEAHVAGMSQEAFKADRKTIDAVVRNLEIIGEAVKNVPPDVRARAPSVEWSKIAGMRDFLAHAYFNVDADIVWEVVRDKLSDLKTGVAALLAGPGDGEASP